MGELEDSLDVSVRVMSDSPVEPTERHVGDVGRQAVEVSQPQCLLPHDEVETRRRKGVGEAEAEGDEIESPIPWAAALPVDDGRQLASCLEHVAVMEVEVYEVVGGESREVGAHLFNPGEERSGRVRVRP